MALADALVTDFHFEEVAIWDRDLSDCEMDEWSRLTLYARRGGQSTYNYLMDTITRYENWLHLRGMYGLCKDYFPRYNPHYDESDLED